MILCRGKSIYDMRFQIPQRRAATIIITIIIIIIIMIEQRITLESVITIPHYVEALKLCRRSVGYKFSVQNYMRHGIHHIGHTVQAILAGQIPAVRNTGTVEIHERGHRRIITPIDIHDRVTQRVLCDYALVPLIKDKLIYDNGASTKGKGTAFSRNRLNQHIEKAKRLWGAENIYVLKFDFKNFFASIPHAQCYRALDRIFEDKRLRDLIMGIIESYQEAEIMKIRDPEIRDREIRSLHSHEKVGICLGSQISQIMALLVPNDIDHFIKDKLGMKFYVRNMDDGIILFNDRKKLTRILSLIREEAGKYGLALNDKKTQIVKLVKGMTFLKIRYRIPTGRKTVKTLHKSGIVRMRRKIKKFVGFAKEKKMSPDDAYASVQSWISHAKIASSFHSVKAMLKLYDECFGGYRITRKYWRGNPGVRRKRKAVRF